MNRITETSLVYLKQHTPKHKQSSVQCSEECADWYYGEIKKPLNKCMAQHRRANSSGQDSAVYLHLKDKGHSFKDTSVHSLDREDRWFKRGVKAAVYIKLEKPSLDRRGVILITPLIFHIQ